MKVLNYAKFALTTLVVTASLAVPSDCFASDSQDRTAENAMNQIVSALTEEQARELHRAFAIHRTLWGPSARCVTVLRENMPILEHHDFTSQHLNIVALTRAGEVLEFIEEVQIIEIPNPLGWQGVNNGTWYHVKLSPISFEKYKSNHKDGWLFAGSSTNSPFAILDSRNETAATSSQNPEEAFIISPSLILLGVGVVIIAIVILRCAKHLVHSGASNLYKGESMSSYSSGGSSAASPPQADWPWRDKNVVIGSKNVNIEGMLSNFRDGHVEKHFVGNDSIHKDGFFSNERVASIERNFWGTATGIVDNSGNKVGNIKETFFGGTIIVDENGKKIGDYKGE